MSLLISNKTARQNPVIISVTDQNYFDTLLEMDEVVPSGTILIIKTEDTSAIYIGTGVKLSETTTVEGGAGAVWGAISGEIEDQEDLVTYIQENGGGVTKILDYESGKAYAKDEVVVGPNETFFRSKLDNNTDPVEETWINIGIPADFPEYIPENTYQIGDTVLFIYDGVGSLLLQALADNPGDPATGLLTTWDLLGFLSDPLEWDENTEYSPFMDLYPTIVTYLGIYYSSVFENKGVVPSPTPSWEELPAPLTFDDNFNVVGNRVVLGGKNVGDDWWRIFNRGSSLATTSNSIQIESPFRTNYNHSKVLAQSSENSCSVHSRAIVHLDGGSQENYLSSNVEIDVSNRTASTTEPWLWGGINIKTTKRSEGAFSSNSIYVSSDLIEITSENNTSDPIGLVYKSNYSVGGKLYGDRWIPDWGAVKSEVGRDANGNVTTGQADSPGNAIPLSQVDSLIETYLKGLQGYDAEAVGGQELVQLGGVLQWGDRS